MPTNNLTVITGGRQGDMRDAFDRALEHLDDCDGMIIVMQKKDGGLMWFGPAMGTLERTVWMLWSMMCHLGRMG